MALPSHQVGAIIYPPIHLDRPSNPGSVQKRKPIHNIGETPVPIHHSAAAPFQTPGVVYDARKILSLNHGRTFSHDYRNTSYHSWSCDDQWSRRLVHSARCRCCCHCPLPCRRRPLWIPWPSSLGSFAETAAYPEKEPDVGIIIVKKSFFEHYNNSL